MERLDPATTAVLVIDVQQRLAQVMPEQRMQDLVRCARILSESARLLGSSVWATEQYPKGIGPIIEDVDAVLKQCEASRFEKTEFSACDCTEFARALEQQPLRAAVVVGMEAHVCVFQTVRDLVARGLEVHVPIDGVVSRREDHREAGLSMCEQVGAVRTTAETVAFDWLGGSGSEAFKSISRLIR